MYRRILITGSDGLLGSNLKKILVDTDEVVGISLENGYDITNYDSMTTIEGHFDIVIHCAAAFFNDSLESIFKNEYVNAIGTYNVCKFALERKCTHFIYISSISAIEHEMNEYYNSYGVSKKHGEDMVQLCCKNRIMNNTILRFSQIYDSDGIAKKHQKLLYTLIEKVKNGEEIIIYGEKNPLRNFIHIDDVKNIIRLTIDTSAYGSFNCVYPHSYSIEDIIHQIASLIDVYPKIKKDVSKDDIKTMYIPDENSFFDIINYYPQINLKDGINRIINKHYEKV
ncbi:MAG: NAD-dependent epimerase/dehydratase family protein [Candidatus Thorarchaeota archaeon]